MDKKKPMADANNKRIDASYQRNDIAYRARPNFGILHHTDEGRSVEILNNNLAVGKVSM